MNQPLIYSKSETEFPTYLSLPHMDDIEITFNVSMKLMPIDPDPDSELDWEIQDITWDTKLFDDVTNEYIRKYVTEFDTMVKLCQEIYDYLKY